jgi:hypothetical protein
MSAKEKQAAAKQTFVFHAPLMSKQSAKADDRAREARVCEFKNSAKEKQAVAKADICFSCAINEQTVCESRR